MTRLLFVLQRVTALVLAPLVFIHLGLILYAIKGGLTGSEILARTQDNILWGAFYGLFVIAASIHGPIGMRNILKEWSNLPLLWINRSMLLLSIILLVLGLRAVFAVI